MSVNQNSVMNLRAQCSVFRNISNQKNTQRKKSVLRFRVVLQKLLVVFQFSIIFYAQVCHFLRSVVSISDYHVRLFEGVTLLPS